MTAIWPAGPPKVCSEIWNHALVASPRGITSPPVGWVTRSGPVMEDLLAPSASAGLVDDPADRLAVGEPLYAGGDVVERQPLAHQRVHQPLVGERGQGGVALEHGGRVVE